jgi:hypothetical protein
MPNWASTSSTTPVRALSTAMQDAAAAAHTEGTHLLELNYSGGAVRLTTLHHDIVWNGSMWNAVGGHLSFEAVRETPGLAAQAVRVTLDGVDQTVISPVLAQHYVGRIGRIYQGTFTSSGGIVDGSTGPYEMFKGLLNAAFEVDEVQPQDNQPGTVTVRTQFTSPLTLLTQTRGIKADLHSHQAATSSGDTFFRHMTGIPQHISWGRSETVYLPNLPGQTGQRGQVDSDNREWE